eukprot:5732624-Prymnesium_polylepis.2
MCRKLTLGGWVLLVGEESEYARILVALLISTSFLALFLNVKPQHRRVSRRCRVDAIHVARPGRGVYLRAPDQSLPGFAADVQQIWLRRFSRR